ncbi:MAG: MraY family glycosyltransferase, partial [Flavobacteriaceae bacterium]
MLINILFINLWNSPALIKFHGVYQAEQKIHEGSIPRFGGLAILISILSINYFDLFSDYEIEYLNHILICLSPLIFVTFLEDVYNNILPQARLFFIFFSAAVLLTTSGFTLPVIDVPIVAGFFEQYPAALIIFLTIAIAAMVNAFNLIDGANGLLLFSFMSILGCLIMMAGFVNDGYFTKLCQVFLGILIIQLPFNFPKAMIFAGDLGAYMFGFILALLVIIFFGRHPEFLTWQAILILFYPAFELLFTVIRRARRNKNPMQADRL